MNFPFYGGICVKIKKKILIIILFVLLTVFLTSCIKSGMGNNEEVLGTTEYITARGLRTGRCIHIQK